jgi:hypothetical protein
VSDSLLLAHDLQDRAQKAATLNMGSGKGQCEAPGDLRLTHGAIPRRPQNRQAEMLYCGPITD